MRIALALMIDMCDAPTCGEDPVYAGLCMDHATKEFGPANDTDYFWWVQQTESI